jgi:Acetyltransferase (isoleucine patch superfamily)
MPRRTALPWRRFWIRLSRPHGLGRLAARLARLGVPPYHASTYLAHLHVRGFVAPTSHLAHPHLSFGKYVYVGDRVNTFADFDQGEIHFRHRVEIYGDCFLRTGPGGRIDLGDGTHVQPGCYFVSWHAPILVGRKVEIAPGCAFYSSTHGIEPGQLIMEQPISAKGPIVIGDGAWLGHRVTVLSGVTIGAGAVVGAGSVVTRDIPDNAIAGGIPARVIGHRTASRSATTSALSSTS